MVTLGVTYLDNSLNTKLTPETVIVKNYLEIILNSLCHYIRYFSQNSEGKKIKSSLMELLFPYFHLQKIYVF